MPEFALMVNVSSWPLISCFKEGGVEKIFLGKPFIYIYGKPSGQSSWRLPPFKIKSNFPYFPYQLFLHATRFHMAVLGNPLKRAVRLHFAGQTAFSPIGNIPLHFLESVGVALCYDVIFFLRNELYFHAVFHIFDRAQMSSSWTRSKTWKWYKYGKTETTLFVCELSSDLHACIQKEHPRRNKTTIRAPCGVSQQQAYSYPGRSKFFESDSPISSPSLAWLPWPFSRGFLFP